MYVLQDWLEQIPIRMQSTLLLSLRGPDTHRCPEVKKVQRWLRGLTFKPGNPDNVAEFMMDVEGVPDLYEKGALAYELYYCTQHFYSHLMHGLEVIAYRHPEFRQANKALVLFNGMATSMHLMPETCEQFETRLGTRDWPSGSQPNDFEEAIACIQAGL